MKRKELTNLMYVLGLKDHTSICHLVAVHFITKGPEIFWYHFKHYVLINKTILNVVYWYVNTTIPFGMVHIWFYSFVRFSLCLFFKTPMFIWKQKARLWRFTLLSGHVPHETGMYAHRGSPTSASVPASMHYTFSFRLYGGEMDFTRLKFTFCCCINYSTAIWT